MALKPVDKASYAIVRTFIAAGAAIWDRWNATGKLDWPNSDPKISQIMDTIFGYVPYDAVQLSAAQIADDPDCAVPGRKSTCFYLTGQEVFSPANRSALIQALDARTPADVAAAFTEVPADSDLEWWAVALTSGALIAIGGLPFAGAAVFKIAGYLLAAWTAYQFVTPKTEGGKSIAERWYNNVSDGLENFIKKAGETAGGVLKIAAAALGLYFVYTLLKGK